MATPARDLFARTGAVARRAERDADSHWQESSASRHVLHDSLLGLPNLLLFGDRLDQALASARRTRSRVTVATVCLGPDDEIGEPPEDGADLLLLRDVARRVRRLLRDCDTVARIGEYELGLVLPETDEHGAVGVAARIFASVAGLRDGGIRIGVAVAPYHGEDGALLLCHAQDAANAAQQDGVPFSIYQGGVEASEPGRVLLLQDFWKASEDVSEALQESEDRYHELFENASDMVFVVDLQGRFIDVNGAVERITGYRREEIRDRHLSAFCTPESTERAVAMMQRKLSGDERSTYLLDLIDKDGGIIAVEVSTWLLRRGGRPIAIQGIARDISERLALQRQKDHFLSVVSHELRSPLTSIAGFVDLLVEDQLGPLSSQQSDVLHIVKTSTDRLIRLVNEILDVQRAETGTLTLRKRPCDLADLAAQAAAAMTGMARSAGITLETTGESITLEVDSDRMLQVLTNLISNAVKFSP